MNLYLIGMPGSGKTTLGKRLAQMLGYTFIDLDALIEQKALMFIDEFFHRYGEKTFRKWETEALISLEKEEHLVIACGGGIVENPSHKKRMKGIVFFLDVPLNELLNRLEGDTIRPLLKQEPLASIFNRRKSLYLDFADYVIKHHDLDHSLTDIMAILKGIF